MTKNAFDDEEPLMPTPTGTPTLAPNALGSTAIDRQRLKKIILIAVPLILCAIAGAIFFFKVIRSPKNYKPGESNAVNAEQIISNSYLELKEMIVNLAPSGPAKNYLKISLILQLSSDQDTKIVASKMPIIIDNFYLFMRELRATDFNSTGTTLQFKEELLKRANKITAPIVIKDILFKEMVVN